MAEFGSMLQNIFNLHLHTNHLFDSPLRTIQLRLTPATRQLMENTGLMKRQRGNDWEIYAPKAAAGLASLLPADDWLEFEIASDKTESSDALEAETGLKTIYIFCTNVSGRNLSFARTTIVSKNNGLLARVAIKLSDLLAVFKDKAIDYELRLPVG